MGYGPGMGMGCAMGFGPGMGWGMGRGMGMGRGQMMGGRGMGGRMMGEQGMEGRGMMRGGMLQQLNLTDAQKTQMKAFREQQQKDGQAIQERMRAARQRLQETMNTDVPDEAAVKTAAAALSAVQADRFALQARSKGQMMKLLTPDQQKQLKEFRDQAGRMGRRGMMGPAQQPPPPVVK
ncbi:MAG: Spy/CpxP family protein refolding chaperone [Acidobacteria bacterium]|nr:Spy/CpxP family protein refolding chaperone [Acidobacteriota bacterium]